MIVKGTVFVCDGARKNHDLVRAPGPLRSKIAAELLGAPPGAPPVPRFVTLQSHSKLQGEDTFKEFRDSVRAERTLVVRPVRIIWSDPADQRAIVSWLGWTHLSWRLKKLTDGSRLPICPAPVIGVEFEDLPAHWPDALKEHVQDMLIFVGATATAARHVADWKTRHGVTVNPCAPQAENLDPVYFSARRDAPVTADEFPFGRPLLFLDTAEVQRWNYFARTPPALELDFPLGTDVRDDGLDVLEGKIRPALRHAVKDADPETPHALLVLHRGMPASLIDRVATEVDGTQFEVTRVSQCIDLECPEKPVFVSAFHFETPP
ncbi:MAG: hypothetical protein V2I65_12870 [Paracoccaceae bacterium]|jgi:hypothetical protein|nr:hypothetical protein [Paracoccaceae bacterium]